jgi:hypothetical protein
MVVVFPRRLLRENSHDWNIVGNTMGAGQTSGASVDVRSDGGGLWSASLNDIQFRDQADARLWRAVRQLCNGGVVPIIVPRNDAVCAPFPAPEYADIAYSDGSEFDDGTGFYQPVIDVQSFGSAALRATTMVLKLNYCAPLQGGESFAIEHATYNWRMYEIATAVPIDDVYTTITFNPPLREAVADGDLVEFDRPRCTMKLVNAGAMDLNFTTWPFSTAGVKFIESKYAS